MAPRLSFHPPLLNTACPWATTADQLHNLLACPSTGAITTRTSLITGFPHDDTIHRHAFFNAASNTPSPSPSAPGSINSYGYSPLPLPTYLDALAAAKTTKTAIISVTGSPRDIAASYALITAASSRMSAPLAMEINLSCPNIPGAAPPAYNAAQLAAHVEAVPESPLIPIGIKVPPYTYAEQFTALVDVLATHASRISFVTATNTLGSCVVDEGAEFLAGGMAGVPLHALSLGNVRTLRSLLDERGLGVDVIGVGGVVDGAGYRRMRKAGAFAVGLATALGVEGVGVFERIERDIGGRWDI